MGSSEVKLVWIGLREIICVICPRHSFQVMYIFKSSGIFVFITYNSIQSNTEDKDVYKRLNSTWCTDKLRTDPSLNAKK